VSDATIWGVTLESSITTPEVSFTIIYDVYSTGITYDARNMFLVQATEWSISECPTLTVDSWPYLQSRTRIKGLAGVIRSSLFALIVVDDDENFLTSTRQGLVFAASTDFVRNFRLSRFVVSNFRSEPVASFWELSGSTPLYLFNFYLSPSYPKATQ
jgi:hypothetical protein